MNTNIRWLIRRDMPEVLDIERASFDEPWTDDEFMSCLRQRNCIGHVIEQQSYELSTYAILGFCICELHERSRRILRIAVHPDCRNQGVGADMVEAMKLTLQPQKRRCLTATIRESSLGAQLFFRAMGLRCEDVKRGYFSGYGEDGYEFVYRLAERVQPSIREGA